MIRHRSLAEPASAFFLLSLLLAGGCADWGRPPANVDISTPHAAAMAYLLAVQRGDAGAARALSVGTEEQKQWVDGIVAMVRGMRAFDKALFVQFGTSGAQVHTDMRDALWALADEPVELFRDALPLSEANTARIDPPHKGFTSKYQLPIYLSRDKWGWKVDLAQTYGGGASPDKLGPISVSFKQYRQYGDVFSDVASRVRAGWYKSVDEAARALAERMQDAMQQ